MCRRPVGFVRTFWLCAATVGVAAATDAPTTVAPTFVDFEFDGQEMLEELAAYESMDNSTDDLLTMSPVPYPTTWAPVAQTDVPTYFTGPLTASETVYCSSNGCSASMSVDTSAFFIDTAMLTLKVGGDLGWQSSEKLDVSVNGNYVGSCGGFVEQCNSDFEDCLLPMDVTEAARTGSVDISFQASPTVNPICSYLEMTKIAAMMTAYVDMLLANTDSPTPAPSTTQIPVTPSPTVAGPRQMIETASCSSDACSASMAMNTQDLSVLSASLSLEAGGDVGWSASEFLTVSVGGVVVGTCGGYETQCNNPLEPCTFGVLDVTTLAQGGLVEVSFEASSTVNPVCSYQGISGQVAGLLKATLDLTVDP